MLIPFITYLIKLYPSLTNVNTIIAFFYGLRVRVGEMRKSIKIIQQATNKF
jgi:NADH:ubiquinone oxidoreductase subunit D